MWWPLDVIIMPPEVMFLKWKPECCTLQGISRSSTYVVYAFSKLLLQTVFIQFWQGWYLGLDNRYSFHFFWFISQRINASKSFSYSFYSSMSVIWEQFICFKKKWMNILPYKPSLWSNKTRYARLWCTAYRIL